MKFLALVSTIADSKTQKLHSGFKIHIRKKGFYFFFRLPKIGETISALPEPTSTATSSATFTLVFPFLPRIMPPENSYSTSPVLQFRTGLKGSFLSFFIFLHQSVLLSSSLLLLYTRCRGSFPGSASKLIHMAGRTANSQSQYIPLGRTPPSSATVAAGKQRPFGTAPEDRNHHQQ